MSRDADYQDVPVTVTASLLEALIEMASQARQQGPAHLAGRLILQSACKCLHRAIAQAMAVNNLRIRKLTLKRRSMLAELRLACPQDEEFYRQARTICPSLSDQRIALEIELYQRFRETT